MQCAKHPKVETALSCGRCATPICPSCAVSGAVGMLCPSCGSNKASHLYQVQPGRFVLAGVLGLAAGTVVGLGLQMVSGTFVLFLLFVASAVGGGVGELILRITGRKRGPKIEFLAGLSVIGGALLSLLIRYGTHLSIDLIFSRGYLFIWFAVATLLMAAAAIGKIKYF
ncbi:MAG: B-box zinc finger protein [Armatimonadota bacterium]